MRDEGMEQWVLVNLVLVDSLLVFERTGRLVIMEELMSKLSELERHIEQMKERL
jgi:hypothetical protein